MLTIDEVVIKAPVDLCFRMGADVERWPTLLPHYRWVTFLRREGFGRGRVEMAARREFGPLSYPVWWVSEMSVDEDGPAVFYRHVDGITSGMDVLWSFSSVDASTTSVRIVHQWEIGPSWPLPRWARRAIADLVIGPVFIHHVASRTLAGIKAAAESTTLAVGSTSP